MLDLDFLLVILVWFGGNATIAMLVAVVIDLFKRFGLVKDGDAGKWSAVLNILALAGFSVYFFLNPDASFTGVDEQIALILKVVQIILGYFLQIFASTQAHTEGVWRGIPLFYAFDPEED